MTYIESTAKAEVRFAEGTRLLIKKVGISNVVLDSVIGQHSVVQSILFNRCKRVHRPRYIVAILPLADLRRSKDGRSWLARQRHCLTRLAQLIIGHTRVVTKVLRVNTSYQ